MARYSVDSTMPAALSTCQGLLPSLLGLDADCPEAKLSSPSCTSAGQSAMAVLPRRFFTAFVHILQAHLLMECAC